MNYYIVKANEKIEQIIKQYNLSFEEVKANNQHIVNWDKLVPGTKLKIPKITEALCDELDCVEPFIEEFYPKIDVSKYQDSEVHEPFTIEQPKKETKPISKTKKPIYPPYFYPYQGYYYPRRKRK